MDTWEGQEGGRASELDSTFSAEGFEASLMVPLIEQLGSRARGSALKSKDPEP